MQNNPCRECDDTRPDCHTHCVTPAPAPPVVNLGNCVVERDSTGFLVMFANGDVQAFRTYTKAQKAINEYFAKRTPKDAIGVGQMVSYDGSITPLRWIPVVHAAGSTRLVAPRGSVRP